jgi:hypothetical protein
MTDEKAPKNASQRTARDYRADRLRSALRENLKKRKAQVRGRAQGAENTAKNAEPGDPAIPPESLLKDQPRQD